MTRPPWEVADVIQRGGSRFLERYRGSLTWQQVKAFNAITRCRTAALGGHVERCEDCFHMRIAYNSCRNRHCPKCQWRAAQAWLEARKAELLPVPYFHVVFTLPDRIAAIAYQNKAVVYDLLFKASSEAVLTIAADPEHLGARIGITEWETSVLPKDGGYVLPVKAAVRSRERIGEGDVVTFALSVEPRGGRPVAGREPQG